MTDALEEEKHKLEDEMAVLVEMTQNERLANFLKALKARDGTISEFDGSLWGSMVEFVTVGRNKEITVTFRDSSEIMA